MFAKGSVGREMGKAFGISFAATFGSMAGLLAFGIAAEKYLDRRPESKTGPKIFQIDKRAAAMKRAGYKNSEIDDTLLGKDGTEDDTGVVTKD